MTLVLVFERNVGFVRLKGQTVHRRYIDMVEAAMRKVSDILTGITASRAQKVQRKLLLILALKGKKRFVIESEHIIHHNRHCFKKEAVQILLDKFRFGRSSDLHVEKPFRKKGIEYRPIVVQWEYLDELVGPPDDVTLTPIDEYVLADKIKSFFR